MKRETKIRERLENVIQHYFFTFISIINNKIYPGEGTTSFTHSTWYFYQLNLNGLTLLGHKKFGWRIKDFDISVKYVNFAHLTTLYLF